MSTTTARVFRLPDLGEGLTEAGLVQWLVKVGDTIATDQAIAEVETAKSIVELPSPFAGVITALHGEPGDVIDVGAPVLEVASDAAEAPTSAASDTTEKDAYRAEERAGSGSGNVLIGYGTTERTGSGRRRPRAASAASAQPATPAAAVPAAPAPTAPDAAESTTSPRSQAVQSTASGAVGAASTAKHAPVAVRSPLVRRLARDLGVDVHTITGTGSDGAITRADVLRAAVDTAVDGVTISAPATASPSPAASAATNRGELDGLAVLSRERMSPLRKAVSAKLSRSRAEIPEATVWVDVDATELWNLRAQMAPQGGKAPSLTALIARYTLIALAEYPLLASRLSEDATEIISFEGVNLGIAADTDRGLMVPVIPKAHVLSVEELDASLRELAATARAGGMPPERLRGSTFTLNNYGGFGVDGSTPIINHPDVAMLGIGRMIERPWVVDGAIVARRIAQISLVFDHRVCDGGYAAGFLRRVVELIEHPLRAYGRV
ncbi:dihydrolipoamide acetyltransferase family protein [Microbacterium arabinogalactanolyticum]|uniref:dihydrolipoamide acetyltransferase family protein n=1 Tax=Microbacterium arabinogalactanolyticum TaxID=69365 RepID=UPI002556C188|nr:dihydrolipoamide acetyltransferase family protein [Microbacterium arabinogalactanolyticum]GLC85159.1 dihydrolipoamide acetyltransferase component of pyruvate dehydrogenase complex [Microbacterium arabinogalactanolyticum]